MTGWVLITRGPDQVVNLAAALERHDLRVVPYPTLREASVDDEPGWKAVTERLDAVRWLVFTSPRGVRNFFRQTQIRGLVSSVASLPVAAVGERTALVARDAGFDVELVGCAGGAELGSLLLGRVAAGSTVLNPCGREHRPELADVLATGGVAVLRLVVYGTELTPPQELPELPAGRPRAVVLSSPRAARGYFEACGRRFVAVPHLAFGAASAAESESRGVPAVTLARPTTAAIVEELCPTS
jgi:uroporphyrinogen-III synthase